MDSITQVPFPQVVLTNYAFAHSVNDHLHQFKQNFESTEKAYWKEFKGNASEGLSNLSNSPYLFYQGAKHLHGKRNMGTSWSAQNFRRSSDTLRQGYQEEGNRFWIRVRVMIHDLYLLAVVLMADKTDQLFYNPHEFHNSNPNPNPNP
jgi:hypothetical protein